MRLATSPAPQSATSHSPHALIQANANARKTGPGMGYAMRIATQSTAAGTKETAVPPLVIPPQSLIVEATGIAA